MAKENKILYLRKHQNKRAGHHKELARLRCENKINMSPNASDDALNADVAGIVISGFIGRVTSVLMPDGTTISATIKRDAPTVPVVGDRVVLNDENIIERVRPRVSKLVRIRGLQSRRRSQEHVIAANVDVAVIVATVASPRFSPEFVDRYLVLCEYGNVTPVIVLNKADLTDERDPIVSWYKKMGIMVIETSAVTLAGIDKLHRAIAGRTVVFVGKSGAGKSSLINALFPGMGLKTNNISEKANQGQHTTVVSNLYVMDDGTHIIDTPGIRTLDIAGIDAAQLSHYFPEIKKCGQDCKYTDCTHTHEDGCMVKAAASSGEIPDVRYRNYLRILGGMK